MSPEEQNKSESEAELRLFQYEQGCLRLASLINLHQTPTLLQQHTFDFNKWLFWPLKKEQLIVVRWLRQWSELQDGTADISQPWGNWRDQSMLRLILSGLRRIEAAV